MTPQDHRETQNGRVTSPKDGAFHRQLHVRRQKGKGGQILLSSTFPLEHKKQEGGILQSYILPPAMCWTPLVLVLLPWVPAPMWGEKMGSQSLIFGGLTLDLLWLCAVNRFSKIHSSTIFYAASHVCTVVSRAKREERALHMQPDFKKTSTCLPLWFIFGYRV